MSTHEHPHTHGPVKHTHEHGHDDPHHGHSHPGQPDGTKHTHEHTHDGTTHSHDHDDHHHRSLSPRRRSDQAAHLRRSIRLSPRGRRATDLPPAGLRLRVGDPMGGGRPCPITSSASG